MAKQLALTASASLPQCWLVYPSLEVVQVATLYVPRKPPCGQRGPPSRTDPTWLFSSCTNPRKAQITLICPIEIAICCYSLRVCSDWYVLQTSLQNIARRGMQHELLIHLAQPMDWDKLGEEVSYIAGDHDQNKTSLILACD